MIIDRYTKIILTVIAISLVGILFKNELVSPTPTNLIKNYNQFEFHTFISIILFFCFLAYAKNSITL